MTNQKPGNFVRKAVGQSHHPTNYGPKDYVGRRGGDLIIEIDQSNASIVQELWGQ